MAAAATPLERQRSLGALLFLTSALLCLFFLGIAAVLGGFAWLAHWIVVHVPGHQGWLGAALCGMGGLRLAYWAWPHPHRPTPRGTEITPRSQPALFDELRAVARAVGEPLPTRVTLHDEADASVTEIEDGPGLGEQRVLQLGMPLLRAISVGELRALVAHELGHFHSEHRYGRWMRRAYLAMRMTARRMDEVVEQSLLLKLPLLMITAPFRLIAWAFLRAAMAANRQQERHADALAVRVAGSAAMIGMLRQLHVAELMLRIYREQHVVPALKRGLMPPLGEGFSWVMASEGAAKLGERLLRACEREATTTSDSHPSLAERIDAAERSAQAAPLLRESPRPAIELVDDPEQYETEPLWKVRGGRRVPWSEVDEIYSAWNSPTTLAAERAAPRELPPTARATSPEAATSRTPQLSEGAGGGYPGSLTSARRSC